MKADDYLSPMHRLHLLRLFAMAIGLLIPAFSASALPANLLAAGRVTLTFVEGDEQTPQANRPVMLMPNYPTARPLEARTDHQGQASWDVAAGSYLLAFDFKGLGIIRFDTGGRWQDGLVIIPSDYDSNPAGRPFLAVSSEDPDLVLLAARDEPNVPEPSASATPSVAQVSGNSLNDFLKQGQIQAGIAFFEQPDTSEEYFSLAFLQATEALHDFITGLNQFPFRQEANELFQFLPFLRLAQPDIRRFPSRPATPEALGALFYDLREGLQRANRTAAQVEYDDFKVEVNLSQWRLPQAGQPAPPILEILGPLFDLPTRTPEGEDIIVRFDAADAKWLEGYTHVLNGLLELILAYDWTPLWDHIAHLLFVRYSPEPTIVQVGDPQTAAEWGRWVDWIAAVHAWRLELADPQGVARARDAFLSMIDCSRESWARILAETDDDHEWIPSPNQTGPAGATISQSEIDGWMAVLNEWEAILRGDTLVPHWRFLPDRGINVTHLVDDPPLFDLVSLIQGHALAPYVAIGPVSSQADWMELVAPFGGRFIRFGVWIN